MWRRVGILLTDVSEERIAPIFRVEEINNDDPAWAGSCSLELPVHAGSSLVNFFYPEDGGDTFLRNVG
jgi:hypothetical protein